MKQPVLGVVASSIIVVLSLAVVWLLGVDLLMGWASYALMGAIPFAIVVGAFWHGEEPRAVAGLPSRRAVSPSWWWRRSWRPWSRWCTG